MTCTMEYYGKTLCISARELVDGGIITASNYRQLAARGRLEVARRGGGAKGRTALVIVDSLPTKYKEKVRALCPDGDAVRLKGWIVSNYEVDQAAVAFFHDRARTGIDLPEDKIREYVVNASVLNTCILLFNRARDARRLMGERYDWEHMAAAVAILKEAYGHTLPGSMLRFRKKVAEYKKNGYGCLISGKFGNQSARKVDYKTERLILGIAVLPNKPFNTNVLEMYNAFVCGELDVYDPTTGELFNPEDFCDKKTGAPLTLSETTITNYLNKPKNRVLIEHRLTSWSTFMHEQTPHVHRHGGAFSLSQITMDDVDLTRKLKDTKQRVHAYYAYDVVSQCVIGASYGREKTEGLVLDCFRDMFRLIDKNGWGMPAGIEVENHLMSQYKDGFLQAGVAFPFVHFCAPLNSQEKYAEQLNGAKKRSVIHKNHEGIGRFYGKGKWRMESKKVSDASNDTWEDKAYFSFEELVADDRRDCAEWNAAPHPNQKMFPGMSRWDVLTACINPTLRPLDKVTLARYVGERVETTIRRNSTVRVDKADWWLSDTSVLERLRPNNYKVTAYYLPDENGAAVDVYLFQGGKYIDKVERVETYNRVMAEQTAADAAAYTAQQKKIAKFRKYVTDNAIGKVGVLDKSADGSAAECESAAVAVPEVAAAADVAPEESAAELWRRALDDL